MNVEDESVSDRLDAFDAGERREALLALLQSGALADAPATGSNHNMHMHSFFSYHAQGWSPTRNAWEARRQGLYAAGLCDFDVLDGVEEFLDAGLLLGLRTAAHLETRVFFDALADVEISSPGEPGVTYIMGAGFVRPCEGAAAGQLAAFRTGARERNLALIGRINVHLGEIALDFDRDVAPLTPAGNATERHIVSAYVDKAWERFPGAMALAEFWASVLCRDLDEVAALLSDRPAFEEAVRSRLVKSGGLGYAPPSRATFPPIADFVAWVRDCEAIPMIAWLDGTTAGERDAVVLIDAYRQLGLAALNIIPDRNWRLRDPEQRRIKVAKLHEIVAAATALEMPINIGTEMNKLGLPFVDELDGEALAPHKAIYQRGARIMVGHSLLSRFARFPYGGAAALEAYPNIGPRNTFFENVGALPPLSLEGAEALRAMGPERALAHLHDQARAVSA